MKVNLFDKTFSHSIEIIGHATSTLYLKPEKLEWVHQLMKFDGITVFTDHYLGSPLVEQVKSKIKVAWLFEPKAIRPEIYKIIKRKENNFDYIFTHDEDLLKRNEKYIKCLHGGTWIKRENWGLHEKNKLKKEESEKRKKEESEKRKNRKEKGRIQN